MERVDRPANRAMIIGLGLAGLGFPVWILTLATLSHLDGSDAAQAYGEIETGILWILLAALGFTAYALGRLSKAAIAALLILLPLSGFAAMTALDLLTRPELAPYLWPIIVPALVPPIVAAFCLRALSPEIRLMIPSRVATPAMSGAILLLCLSILPMQEARNDADRGTDQRAASEAAFLALPGDAPLWAFTPFLATKDKARRDAVLERIRHLDRRQGDAEIMLERGDFPLGQLGAMDLDPTPAICSKARDLLHREPAALMPQQVGTRPYSEIDGRVEDAVAAMEWLVGYGCSCDAEAQAWQDLAQAYRDHDFDTRRLAELRDPARLGKILREDPARFSMLTPQSHLKAWLKFADESRPGDPAQREQALAGARMAVHRNEDAVEILKDGDYPASVLMAHLPELDIRATRELCGEALKMVRGELARVYRPPPEESHPYAELLERLAPSRTLTSLTWLAMQGCDANSELAQTISLIHAYQESPEASVMVDTLAGLRRDK